MYEIATDKGPKGAVAEIYKNDEKIGTIQVVDGRIEVDVPNSNISFSTPDGIGILPVSKACFNLS